VERQLSKPAGWVKGSRAQASALLDLTFAVKHDAGEAAALQQWLLSRSPGQAWLSQHETEVPVQAGCSEVLRGFFASKGVEVSKSSSTDDFIHATVPVAVAELLLAAKVCIVQLHCF
jgi:hypothetical protein